VLYSKVHEKRIRVFELSFKVKVLKNEKRAHLKVERIKTQIDFVGIVQIMG